MKTKLIYGILFAIILMNFISSAQNIPNGYWNEETQECWQDKDHAVGKEYPIVEGEATFKQCCLNFNKKQVDCNNSSIILYPDEEEIEDEEEIIPLEITINSPDEHEIEHEIKIDLNTNIPAKCTYAYGNKYQNTENSDDNGGFSTSIIPTFFTKDYILTDYYTLKHLKNIAIDNSIFNYNRIGFECISETGEKIFKITEINIKKVVIEETEQIDNNEQVNNPINTPFQVIQNPSENQINQKTYREHKSEGKDTIVVYINNKSSDDTYKENESEVIKTENKVIVLDDTIVKNNKNNVMDLFINIIKRFFG